MGKKRKVREAGLRKRLLSAIDHMSPRLHYVYALSMVAAVLLTVMTLVTIHLILSTQAEVDRTNEAYQACQQAVDALREASDFLTSESRQFVTTGDRKHLDAYVYEVDQLDRRGQALESLRQEATSAEAIEALEAARTTSDELSRVELYALRLGAEAYNVVDVPETVQAIELEDADSKLSVDDKCGRAYELLYGTDYMESKFAIRDDVDDCSELLVKTLRVDLEHANSRLASLVLVIHLGVILLLLVVFFVIASSVLLLLWPMARYEVSIRDDEPLVPSGSKELRLLVDAYNDMYAANSDRTESLSFEARNDALTGLLNRGSFNNLLTRHKESSALILVDVDNFKTFNDEHGHEMGDAILIEVAATIYASFRSTDYVCRIGGDEFAVIMTKTNSGMRDVIEHKINKIASFLHDTENGLPAASVSVGVAFGAPGCTDDGLFKEADKALYHTKEQGRDGYTFAEDIV